MPGEVPLSDTNSVEGFRPSELIRVVSGQTTDSRVRLAAWSLVEEIGHRDEALWALCV